MRLVAAVLAMLLASAQAWAESSREEKIAYIIEAENLYGQLVAYNEQLIIRTLQELDKDPALDLSDHQKELIREELTSISGEYIGDYIEDLSEVYDKHLTDGELDALHRFYRSPEGISIGEKLPNAWGEFFWIDARYIQLLSERSRTRVMEILSQDAAQ